MLFFVSQYCSRVVFFFKQKTAYEMLISDWSSDVCSSDLLWARTGRFVAGLGNARPRLWRQFRPQRISRRHRWAASFGRGLCTRSEEHTSELQSLMRISYAVFCLKKKK